MAAPLHGSGGGGLQEYAHRIIHFRQQCDFEYTFCTMLWLCIDPRRVYRNAEYHSRTKHQWARDDPGFVVVMVGLIACSTTAWSVALAPASVSLWLGNVTYTILVDFVGLGLLAAGIAWLLTNGRASAGAAEQQPLEMESLSESAATQLEFAYAFDVHCNSYFPLFLLLHVAQYLLLPLLLGPSHVSSLCSCALYCAAGCGYTYLTFLGYNALPFLRHTEVIILPMGGLVLLALFAVVFGLNPTVSSARFFFSPDSQWYGEANEVEWS